MKILANPRQGIWMREASTSLEVCTLGRQRGTAEKRVDEHGRRIGRGLNQEPRFFAVVGFAGFFAGLGLGRSATR